MRVFKPTKDRENISHISNEILNYIKSNPYITTKELSGRIKVSERTILRHMNELTKTQRFKRYGSKENGYWESDF